MAVVTETWFTSKHDANCLLIPNYSLYRHDRFKRKGGGVRAYIRNDINAKYYTVIIVMTGLRYSGSSATSTVMTVYYVVCCCHSPNLCYESTLFIDALLNGTE